MAHAAETAVRAANPTLTTADAEYERAPRDAAMSVATAPSRPHRLTSDVTAPMRSMDDERQTPKVQ